MSNNNQVSEFRTAISNPRIATALFGGRQAQDALRDSNQALTLFVPVNPG